MFAARRALLRSPHAAVDATWTPASLPGLLLWVDAITGVTNVGGNAFSVTDQSSAGHNLLSSGDVPLNATGFNGHPAFDYLAANAANLYSAPFAIGTGNKGSLFFIGQMRAGTEASGAAVSYSASGADWDAPGDAVWLARDGSSNGILTFRNVTALVTTPISLSTNYMIAVIFDGTYVTHWVNGVMTAQAPCSDNWASSGTLAIGSRVGAAGQWDGPIAEIITTNDDATAHVANAYAYAQSKYGI